MSAPETNVERQTRRHRPALIGIGLAVAAAVIFAFVAFTSEGVPADDQAAGVPPEAAVSE